MGGNELEYVKDVFNKNWIAPVGPHINSFEERLSSIHSNFYVAALSSGTSAIHLALLILGVKFNDDVLCSSFTFAASVNPIKYVGANPVLIDSEKETWNMCPDLLERAIKDGIKNNNKPKAIILVHLYGMPARLNDIIRIANDYEIPIIEDAAEALGSKYNSNPLGTFGDFGVLSFNGNKIITTSGGGALISKKNDLIEKARFLATQARDDQPYYQHSHIGYNYRLSNVCAAIGLGQLDVIDKRVEKKRYINNYYKKNLEEIKEIKFLEEKEGCFSNYWLTTISLASSDNIDREKLRVYLERYNIESRPLWKPMHLQPIYSKCKSYINGVSEDLFNQGLCLPSGTSMKNEELDRVINIIKELYEK